MPSRRRPLAAAALTVAALLIPSDPALAQGKVVEEHTRSVVATYDKAEHWAMRGIVLLSLGPSWSRAAQPMFLSALQSKDMQMRVYALEALASSEPEILQYGLTTELLDELVNKQAKVKSEPYYEKVEEVLFAVFPAVDALEPSEWKKHWRSVRKAWKPTAWPEAFTQEEEESSGETVSGAFVARAFDLYRTGLEVVLVIDSTGSMQPTIDATRAALLDLAAVLQGVAPQLRMGIVHYKDYGDLKSGARILEELSKNPAKVEKALERLSARGGGDTPEAVEAGLRVALSEECGWTRSASKLVVVIGDAPAQRQEEAEELARGAHEKPFGSPSVIPDGNEGTTVSANRPFVVSSLRVRSGGGARRGGPPGGGYEDDDPEAEEKRKRRDPARASLEAIAAAGGGSYAEISATADRDPALEIVAQVLAQSFGRRFREQTDRFLDVWVRYHRDGLFD